MSRFIGSLCAAACILGLAAAAHADPVTYTFVTQSSVPPDDQAEVPTLSLSFTVDGPVSVDANSGFADTSPGNHPLVQETYQFPATLTSFSLSVPTVTEFAVSLASFVSSKASGGTGSGIAPYPDWSIALTADPANETASLSLFFINGEDSDEVSGAPFGFSNPSQISTGASGTIYYGNDTFQSEPSYATYTGMLVASTTASVPEPSSLLLLAAGLGIVTVGARWFRGHLAY